jgi:hypothetical protein
MITLIPVWLHVVLLLLATYRLATMIAWDEGPWRVFARWRDRHGQTTWVGRGFHCPACISFWLAWPLFTLLLAPWGVWIYGPLALSGAAVVLARR